MGYFLKTFCVLGFSTISVVINKSFIKVSPDHPKIYLKRRRTSVVTASYLKLLPNFRFCLRTTKKKLFNIAY